DVAGRLDRPPSQLPSRDHLTACSMLLETLHARLQCVARRQQSLRLWSLLAATWAGAGFLGLALYFLHRQVGWASALTVPLVALIGIAAALVIFVRHQRLRPDFREVARTVEAHHPSLEGRLLTAVQQQPGSDGQFHYLQERLIEEVNHQ